MNVFTKEWLKAALVRSVKTFAQALAAQIGVEGIGFAEIGWVKALSVAGVAAVLSLLTSVGGLPEVDE